MPSQKRKNKYCGFWVSKEAMHKLLEQAMAQYPGNNYRVVKRPHSTLCRLRWVPRMISCEECGIEFMQKSPNQKYCCRRHMQNVSGRNIYHRDEEWREIKKKACREYRAKHRGQAKADGACPRCFKYPGTGGHVCQECLVKLGKAGF